METLAPTRNLTSKVKVEFTDPSGVYQLIESELQARLPLRNLNWNSPGRPVRSIESLHVDLEPDEKTATSQLPKRSTSLAGIATQSEPERPSTPASNNLKQQSDALGPKRERRHQIPGLRRTPYLKVYLLRCDDTEVYKNSARKLLRDWIKSNTPPSQSSTASSSQDNHDAFEWLIVHVVLPDPQGLAIWPSKASISVLDKIRADFNGSSRGTVDRVAQVPAAKDLQVRGATVPGIPYGPAREPFLLESGRAWDDSISKIRELILTSFDLRVRQYEEDIKEKGSQRSLPGWNFCTFFVLKEGLARGFESVGIVEDALMGYDELSAELQSALRSEASKTPSGTETRLFREHTQGLLVQAEKALHGSERPSAPCAYGRVGESILDTSRKSYRELILSNNISAFDFRTYVFARQISLLLSSATRRPSDVSPGVNPGEAEMHRDAAVLEEICRRAIGYVADIAGIMRQDLKVSFQPDRDAGETDNSMRQQVIENLIASYVFSCAEQLLAKTQHPSLPSSFDSELGEDDEDEYEDDPVELTSPSSESQKMVGRAAITEKEQHSTTDKSSVPSLLENQFSYQNHDLGPLERSPKYVGICRLASARAQLFLIARRTLNAVGSRRGWFTAWHEAAKSATDGSDELEEIILENESKHEGADDVKQGTTRFQAPLTGISNETLINSLFDEKTFYQAYEKISLAAFQLFLLCDDRKSSYAITADIAFLRCLTGNYTDSVKYCRELASFYALNDWLELEINVLDAYSYCLKKLARTEEYIRISLRKLARQALTRRSENRVLADSDTKDQGKPVPGSSGPMNMLSLSSQDLTDPIVCDMCDYLFDIHIEPYVRHKPNEDGFFLICNFTSLVPGSFIAHKIRIRLQSINHAHARGIWLDSGSPIIIKSGRCEVELTSNTTIPDWYILDKFILESSNIHLQYNFQSMRTSLKDNEAGSGTESVSFPKILVWPSPDSLKVSIIIHHLIHLEEARAIYVEIQSGVDDVSSASLTLKSGSAGLRLHTAEAQLVFGDCELVDTIQGNELHLASIGSRSRIGINIPYKLDLDMKEISLRSDIVYSTNRGSYVRGESHRLSTQLPLGVNVQDVFKEHHLFSKFSISTACRSPLRLLACELKGNADFDISSPYMENRGLCIHDRQPVALVYRIVPRTRRPNERSMGSRLSMSIEYRCLDEEAVSGVQLRLLEHLEGSEYWKYKEPLQQHLATMMRDHIYSQQELENTNLLREMQLPPFNDFQWIKVLSAIPPRERELVTLQLQQWHKENQVIKLPDEPSLSSKVSQAPRRRIVIPVDLPGMGVLHKATLSVAISSQARKTPTVGDEIEAVLSISHTRRWANPSEAVLKRMAFSYELEAPLDTWLIAGQRRALFSAAEGEELKFPVCLVPMRAGKLMLPTVEIAPVKEEQTGGKGMFRGCEVDYESQGMSVEVFPGIQSVTFEIGEHESGSGGGGGESRDEVRIVEVER